MNDLELEDNIQHAERVVVGELSEHQQQGRQSKVASPERPMEPLKERIDRREPSSQDPSHYGGHDHDKHRRRPFYKDDNLNEEESEIYQPTLWWMTSTAFPLIAGTFGPIANLLSICALVETWRVRIDNGVTIRDPRWLTGLNATSLFLALVANVVLMFNFARRIRYKIAQPITITLWYIASILLVACIALVHDVSVERPRGVTAYTQSYYYGIISSVLYFSVATLLLVSSLGSVVFHAYPPSFSTLTGPQRTLMLQTTSFSFYLALGAGVFSEIEGWGFSDGVYWADYTLLTIGLGTDFPLTTVLARLLLIPYAALGITLVGLVVSSVRGLVLERAKAKVARRHLGKERERWRKNIEERSRLAANKRSLTQDAGSPSLKQLRIDSRLRKRKEEKLMRMPRKLSKYAGVPLKHEDQQGAWHRAEFELMRFIEESSEKTQRYSALLVSFFVILVVWTGGSLIFWSCERNSQGWTYVDSFYFTYTTLLTIGYGDFYPTSSAGKPFFVVWSLLSVPAMTVLISNMGDTVVKGVQEMTVRVSQWTILPERSLVPKHHHHKGPVKELKESSATLTAHALRTDDLGEAESRTRAGGMQPTVPSPLVSNPVSSEGHTSAVLETGVEALGEKIGDFEESENRGGSLAARLAREISNLAKDLRQKPPKKYTWDEWSRWLDMLGERDNADAGKNSIRTSGTPHRTHNMTPIHILPIPRRESMNSAAVDLPTHRPGEDYLSPRQSDATQCNTQPQRHDAHLSTAHSRDSRMYGQVVAAQSDIRQGSNNAVDIESWNWTWLGDHGPLLSPLTETEWIVGKLCVRLEEVLEDEIRDAHASAQTSRQHDPAE